MKLINSGVAFSAARIRSPSFSRFASSVTITKRPWRISSRTSSIGSNTMFIGSHHSLRISFPVKLQSVQHSAFGVQRLAFNVRRSTFGVGGWTAHAEEAKLDASLMTPELGSQPSLFIWVL